MKKQSLQNIDLNESSEMGSEKDIANISVQGNGNVINLGEPNASKSKPPKRRTTQKSQRKKSKLNPAIIIALIGMTGVIIAGVLSSPLIEKMFLPTPIPSPTSTITPVLTPTPVPTITPTPLAFPLAGEDEVLLIVVDFDNRSAGEFSGLDPAQRIYDLIVAELPKTTKSLRVQQYHESMLDDNQARQVLAAYNATLLIWGWYDKLSVEARIIVNDDEIESSIPRSKTFDISAPEDSAVRFTQDVPSNAAHIAFLSLGIMNNDVDYIDDAIKYFDKTIYGASVSTNDETTTAIAYIWRSYIYRVYKHNYDKALADANSAVKIEPQNARTYRSRGLVYEAFGKFNEALADYNKAINIDPESASCYTGRGYVYNRLGNYERALSDFDTAITLDPKYAPAYDNRGYVYFWLGNYDQALVDINKAIEIDPKRAGSYNSRGLVYLELGEYEMALADYNKAIEINPLYADPYYNRGRIYQLQGDTENAIADFQRYLELATDPYWIDQAKKRLQELGVFN